MVEPHDVVKEAASPEVSKLNGSVIKMNHGCQTQFSPVIKTLEKVRRVCYYLYICYLLSHRQTNNILF